MLELYPSSYKIVLADSTAFLCKYWSTITSGKEMQISNNFEPKWKKISTSFTESEVNNCFNMHYTSWMNNEAKYYFILVKCCEVLKSRLPQNEIQTMWTNERLQTYDDFH